MFTPECPKCALENLPRSKIRRHGSYYRTSDGKTKKRFWCTGCRKSFSWATYSLCYRQKKRHKNDLVYKILASTGSQRRTAIILNLSRVTVVRKFLFMSIKAEGEFRWRNFSLPKAVSVEFDDLETFEVTKCRPLSVTLAVETTTRRILGLEVSEMPAKGLLQEQALKYGFRPDRRKEGRQRLFKKISPFITATALIKSDRNPHYRGDVKRMFPTCRHITFKGKRGAKTGQGEIKKVKYDPLFSLNHTCAMLRANINRLIRKTWCTTKSKERLYAHLVLYANFHNEKLLKQS